MAAPNGRPPAVGRFLGWWTDRVARHPRRVVALAVLIAIAGGYYTATHLGVDTDTEDMLSGRLSWRVQYERYKAAFPQYTDEILVIIDGATAGLAAEAQLSIGERLRAAPALFETVYLPGGGPFFERHALLYLDEEELEELAIGLEEAGPWLRELEREPELPRFLSVVDSLMAEASDDPTAEASDDERVGGLIGAVGEAFGSSMMGRLRPLPWRDLLSGEVGGAEGLRRYVVIKPQLDFNSLFPGEPAIGRIRAVVDSLGLSAAVGASVRLTGSVPMADEELRSAIQGLGIAVGLALFMVGGILYAGLRSVRLIGASLFTLLVGLVITSTFAALAVRHLNLISIAFAVLYIGLGIDYAIHYSLRYRELRVEGARQREALRLTAEDVGASLFLSAVTTAACFYAFIPTAFKGVSELGMIGGTGMLISFLVTITLLPALLCLAPFRPKPDERPLVGGVMPHGLARWIAGHRRTVLIGASIVALASAALLPQARFARNPLDLRDPEAKATATFRELLADTTTSPMTIAVLAPDSAAAERLADRLTRLERVEEAITIGVFVPDGQGPRLARIDRIGRVIDSSLEPTRADATDLSARAADLTARLASVETFRRRLSRYEPADEETRDRARFASFQIRGWQRWMEDRPASVQREALDRVESSLLGGLRRSLHDLRASLDAGFVTAADLPADLVERWVSPDGTHRVEVIPRDNLADEAALRAFVADVLSAAPDATGEPVISVSAGEAVVSAFRQALAYAAIATLLLLLLALRSFWDTMRVIVPLLLAGALAGAATVLFGLAFNYANVIALPLLLGVGVDNGIHMVHRSRAGLTGEADLLGTSTARAVLFASLTTIFSFGTLAFSRHPGAASMGQMLTIGMLSVLLCTLVVLPALPSPRRS